MTYTKRDRERKIIEGAEARAAASVDFDNPPPFRDWVKEALWIKPRREESGRRSKKNLIRFDKLTYGQDKFGEYFEHCRANKIAVRVTLHKTRQDAGCSTISLAALDYLTRFISGKTAAFIAHVDSSTQEVFQKEHTFVNNMPVKYQRPLRGGKVLVDGLQYEEPHNSKIIIGTAGTRNLLRGATIDYAHFSELDFWPNPETVMTAIQPALVEPDENWDCVIINESTAAGKGYYYDQVQIAMDPENGIKFFFFSWLDEAVCQVPIAPGEKFVLDPAEVEYKETVRQKTVSDEYPEGRILTNEQMKWARLRRKRKCSGFWEYFNQEYPAYSEAAFLFGGMPWFNQQKISQDLLHLKDPIWTGHITYSDSANPIEWIDDQYGPMKKWSDPKPDHSYVLSLDTGMGVGADFSELCITDITDWELVLHYRSHMSPPVVVAGFAYLLGVYYNLALCVVETIDGSGLMAAQALNEGDINYPWIQPYPNLYKQASVDKVTREITRRLGWRTTKKMKKAVMHRLKDYYDPGILKIHSKELLMQMSGWAWSNDKDNFVQNYSDPISKLANDDGIMSLGIGTFCGTEDPEHHARVKIRRLAW